MTTDPLANARAALAEYDVPRCGKPLDDEAPGSAISDVCTHYAGHTFPCGAGWPDSREAVHVDHLRAALAEADRLRALLTPPPNTTRLPHEWPTDTRDPLVCTHGCGAEPGDVLVEDECPRRLRRALDAAAGPEPGITWDEALHIESTVARGALDALERHGHTPHCAARQAHGDGECECRATDAERAEWARLAAEMSDAYFDHLAPRCSYVSAGDGMRCSLSSGHDGVGHVMMKPADDGWRYVNAMRTALPRLLAALAAAEGERDWLREAARAVVSEVDRLHLTRLPLAMDDAITTLRTVLDTAKETT